LRRLYVKCPNCNNIFPSGFQVESATQLIGLSYLCRKCRKIVPCSPPEYLEKIGDRFEKAIEKEEIFALPIGKRIEITAPDIYELDKEVLVKAEAFLTSTGAIISYTEKGE
jgi:hypothetical protein